MNCPRCRHELSTRTAGAVEVDVCHGGCGGLWFDKRELDKFDQSHETEGEALLTVARGAGQPSTGQRLRCPECTDLVMMRHFYSTRFEVEIDECPGCGGMFLDHGELGRIRSLFSSDEERRAHFESFFQGEFGAALVRWRGENEAKERKARRLANMFRFLCPSAWLPGRQSWGNF